MSYIKNGWENNFIESWQHLSSDGKNAVGVSSPNTNSPNTRPEFPQAANWFSIQNSGDKFPPFTIENMMNYFITRKSGDDEGNKDYKNLSSKAFGLFKHGHVQRIEVATEENGKRTYIRCECLPEMKKNLKYKLNVAMINSGEQAGDITYACCSPCPAGKGPYASCKHLAALCFALEEFVRLGQSREFATCTDRLQAWNQPRKRKLEPRTVYEIDFSKKIYGKEKADDRKILHDPRLPIFRESNTEKANQDLLDKITDAKLECGFFNILSRDKHPSKVLSSDKTPETGTINIISPPKEQPVSLDEIYERADRVKKKLFVDAHERERIKEETKQQSGCQQWFEARKIRITASKCKRAIQKPTTSPTKAMIEILHLKENFQSQQMQQGLEDESKILRMYENRIGCEVNKVGFIISSTHPFLGASPDGEVHEKCLVEAKRIFPGTMTLEEAVCSRGICKKTDSGLIVNKNHAYYYQVQQQLFCSGYSYEDLVLSDLKKIIILSIKRCSSFSKKSLPKLQDFYDQYLAPELAYPRVALGLPRLGKAIRDV